jgi:hypothetical protein
LKAAAFSGLYGMNLPVSLKTYSMVYKGFILLHNYYEENYTFCQAGGPPNPANFFPYPGFGTGCPGKFALSAKFQ